MGANCQINLKSFLILTFLLGAFFLCCSPPATAQSSNLFEAKVRAADGVTLISGKTRIHLWGVESIEGLPASFQLKVRTILDNAIANNPVQCEMKSRKGNDVTAQCVNADDLDLGLFLLQQGFVSVDRKVVYGTVFEEPYIQAEADAQTRGMGVWQEGGQSQASAAEREGSVMVGYGFVLFLCIIGAFSFLSIIIMRGFQKVINAQNKGIDMIARERKLREKERKIIAMMLDSEIKANKTKIEAYLLVYDEMFKALKDPDRPPKYKQAGDIVQMQPALDRVVFDRNTDKLDILGDELSSRLVHFYARIKTKPDYTNLEPEMDLPQAIEIVENALKHAQRLDDVAQYLINAFEDAGLASEYMDIA